MEQLNIPDLDRIVEKQIIDHNNIQATEHSVAIGITNNPDEYARYLRLQKSTGLDPELLVQDSSLRSLATNRDRLSSINVPELYRSAPRTSKFLSTPDNVAISHDDITNLIKMENDYSIVDKALLVPKAIGIGAIADTTASLFGMGAAIIGQAAAEMNLPQKPQTKLSDIFGPESQSMAINAGRSLGVGPDLAKFERFLLDQQKNINQWSTSQLQSDKQGFVSNAVISGLRSLGMQGPTIVAGILTRNPKLALALMGAATGGSSYGEARDKGLSPDKAVEYAALDATAEVVTEMIPVKYILQDGIFRKNIMKAAANYMIKEGTGEEIATLWQDFDKWAYLEPDKTFGDYLRERPSAALATAISVAVSGAGNVAVVHGVDRILNGNATKDSQAYFDALAQGVTDSKLHQRLPEKIKEFIAGVHEAGDVKNVFIDANKFNSFFQDQKINPEQAVSELLGNTGAQQLKDAVISGGDIVIPLETYAEKIAGSEFHQGLSGDLRLRSGDMSVNEIKAYYENPESNIELNHIIEEAKKANHDDSSSVIYDNIYGQALDIGATASQAATWAAIEQARYRTRAARLGVDAATLWEEEGGLIIARPSTESARVAGAREFGQFAGIKAQGARLDLLEQAKQQLKAGVSPEQVRQETGWFVGPDKHARFEIDDSQAVLNTAIPIVEGTTTELDKLIEHPLLFKAYPELASIKVEFKDLGKTEGSTKEGRIVINPKVENPLSVLMHETQHAIQLIEHHAVGASVNEMIGRALTPENTARIAELTEKFKNISLRTDADEAMAIRTEMARVYYENAWNEYRKVYGEIEARNVQARLMLSAAERAGLPPEATQDIATAEATLPSLTVMGSMEATGKETLAQEQRGKVELGNKFRRISLLESADLSTFIHELGHTWLEELQRDAQRPDAPQQVLDDWAAIAKWAGIKENEAILVDSHEQFARATEAYFREGVTPSSTLRTVFHKVKAWLMSVYKNLANLNVKLNPEVRAVFDRMIALDEEIMQARLVDGYVQLFSTPEAAGMTEAEFKAYNKVAADAHLIAQDKLTEEIASKISRERTKEWRKNLIEVRDEELKKALAIPVYDVIQTLSSGTLAIPSIPGIKLSKEGIIEVAGEEALKNLTSASLHTKGWIYSAEGGLHPDTVAKNYGFQSGAALIHAMLSAPPIQEYVKEQTDRTMKERYGDPLDPGEIAQIAQEEVHSDKQSELLEAELAALRKKKIETETLTKDTKTEGREKVRRGLAGITAPVPIAIIKEVAYNEISNTNVNKLFPDRYLQAEVRAGNKAIIAAAKGDYSAAAEAKQQQILNFHLYKEAIRARNETTKLINNATRLSKPKARARIGRAGQEWLQQIDTILNDYSFASIPDLKRARRLADFVKAIEEETGEIIATSQAVLDEAARKNFKELTVDELRAVSDSLTSIEHIAKKITEVMIGDATLEFKEARDRLSTAILQNIALNPIPDFDTDLTKAQNIAKKTKEFFNTNIRPEKLFERMDGGKQGIWHDLFWNQSVKAQNLKDDLFEKIMTPIIEWEKQNSAWGDSMSQTVDVSSLNHTISRRTLIGIALNLGNHSNREKFQKGGMWFGLDSIQVSDSALVEIQSKMEAKDWEFVQMVWDSIKQLYPLLDDLNKRAIGLPLKAIEPTPIVNKYGTFAGGYWPAVADSRHSQIGEKQENTTGTSLGEMFAPKFPMAATTHSFREERTGAVYPIQLDWRRVLAQHVNKAPTDIAYHEWIKQSNRLLKDQSIKKSIQNTLGEDIYRSLSDWLVHQVAPATGGYSSSQGVDNLINAALQNTAVAALGFRAATAIGNMVLAPIQASHQIYPQYIALGLSRYLINPAKETEAVHALSGEMKHRFLHLDATISGVLENLQGKKSLIANIMRYAMAIHNYTDRITSTALWTGKYQQEIDTGKNIEEAALLADKMIRTTQTAGAPKDLSAFERDGRYKMFKLFIGPMIIMQNEIRGTVAGRGISAMADPHVIGTMFSTWIIPAMLWDLIMGRGPDEDADEKEKLKWALYKILLYPAQTVPFIRDAASILDQLLSGKQAHPRSNPISDVLVNVIKEMSSLYNKGESADFEDITVGTTRALGPLTGFPSNQAVIAEQFLFDIAKGETQPYELQRLIYKPKPGQ